MPGFCTGGVTAVIAGYLYPREKLYTVALLNQHGNVFVANTSSAINVVTNDYRTYQ